MVMDAVGRSRLLGGYSTVPKLEPVLGTHPRGWCCACSCWDCGRDRMALRPPPHIGRVPGAITALTTAQGVRWHTRRLPRPGKILTNSFGVKRYGYDQAKQMAIAERQKQLEQVTGHWPGIPRIGSIRKRHRLEPRSNGKHRPHGRASPRGAHPQQKRAGAVVGPGRGSRASGGSSPSLSPSTAKSRRGRWPSQSESGSCGVLPSSFPR
jgi:hypothetical protein